MVRNLTNNNGIKAFPVIIAFCFILNIQFLSGQSTEYKYYYRVFFKDKGEVKLSDINPRMLLSERAIIRRQKSGIRVPDMSDIPVSREYINVIASEGFVLHCTSRWLNTAVFKSKETMDVGNILALPFVSDVKIVKLPGTKSSFGNKLDFTHDLATQSYDNQLSMLNGISVHNSGFRGKGVLIAVLDGGFLNTDNVTSLKHLFNRNGIVATRDFVAPADFVFGYHNHGTAVLSVLAGDIPERIAGSAPEADYILLRTEDTATEFPVEEDFWTAGAEFADSAGADIISSSLGYFNFDDPSMNYKFSDLNGSGTFVTKAARMAVSKGIIVVNSAGNERDNDWLRIIAPSDGENVIATAAVNPDGTISSFSSAGPSADGRVKPDVSAQGVGVTVQVSENLARANGTSFSCPLISGMCACIIEAVRDAKNTEVTKALHYASDRHESPDSLYGYGIPDIAKAIQYLQDLKIVRPENGVVIAPNPFSESFRVIFKDPPHKLKVELYSITGQKIASQNFSNYISRVYEMNVAGKYSDGLYILRLTTENGIFSRKIIKADNP